jgi:hypothetical protein
MSTATTTAKATVNGVPLSPASFLLQADLEMFARLGISPELLREARVQRVMDWEAREKFGIRFAPAARCSGIIFPYYIPPVEWRVGARLRRDYPEIEDGKLKNKYLSSYGDRHHLYYPPDAREKLADPDMPIALVEAEKSVLALTAWARRTGTKLLPLGMGGCWGWRGKVRIWLAPNGAWELLPGPLPDLHDCNGRKVFICLDANVATNSDVQGAQIELVVELEKAVRNCTVRVCSLPEVNPWQQ